MPYQDDETLLDNFVRRVVLDCLLQAMPETWERRAAVFDAAAPRPDEFHGRATREELSAAWRRCRADADLCRRHAALLRSCRADAFRDEYNRIIDQEVPA